MRSFEHANDVCGWIWEVWFDLLAALARIDAAYDSFDWNNGTDDGGLALDADRLGDGLSDAFASFDKDLERLLNQYLRWQYSGRLDRNYHQERSASRVSVMDLKRPARRNT